jgi:hypothetical protein
MKKAEIISALENGSKLFVCLRSDKAYEKMVLKCELRNEEEGTIRKVYHNHCKQFLTPDQLLFIETYNKVKAMQFRDWVDVNVRKNTGSATKEDFYLITMNSSIKKMQYIEQ